MLYSLTLAGGEVGEVSIRDGRYSVTIRHGELAQELLFDAERNLRSSRMFRSGVALWSADYSSLEGRAAFPHQIEILNPDKDMFLKIHFESVNLNSTLDPSVFVIKPPDSVAVEPFPPLEPGSVN